MGETAGFCTGLVAGLRGIGVRADFLNLGDDPFGYADQLDQPRSVRITRWLARRRATRRGPGAAAWTALHRIATLWLFAASVVRYDAFVFRAGDSFFALRDLGLLRRLGKQVVVVFFGTDSRPSYMNGAEVGRGMAGARAVAATADKRRMVERTERHASAVVCHVLSAQLHRRPTVAFLEIGIPRRVPVDVPSPPGSDAGRPIRALHAPSRAAGKGTDAIRAAVADAQARGVPVELLVVSGRPNREVIEAIAACDFVIDQPTSDTPMAAFAAEAAALGRPTIVGGHGWDDLRRITRAEAIPPAHLCRPDELSAAVERLATDHAYRRELGAAARRFVEERWSPESVARRFGALLAGDPPAAWWFDPAAIVYAHGDGMDTDALRQSLRGVLDAAGVDGFGVADKPELERRLVELAGEPTPEDSA